MTKQNPEPPPLAAGPLARVTALSRGNSLSVALFAGLCVAYAALRLQWAAAGWALLALAAGLLEYQGQRAVRAGRARGLRAMVGAQLLLLGVIWAYAWLRVRNFDPEAYWQQFPAFAQELLAQRMRDEGLDPELDRALLMMVTNFLVCAGLALVALVYQGGLAVYYLMKARALRAALGGAEKTPSTAPAAAG
ncbi:MAG TPA: hypothetical protein VEB66_00590 [Opitutaceae bacterium]|nr:hypothetical protein [Opitutaceae bacterium]